MAQSIIQVQNLSKRFIIKHEAGGRQRYTSLRDVITDKVKSVGVSKPAHIPTEEFWALKDLNFNVEQGDRLGIIGRNGAGKSTLLKILSRITEPTSGEIRIKGRVASLLEVGTGFHPELTGSENIFLNGAILGMSRVEIKRKFDEIVDFAEVEKFLDTPVKRYSSGMYVRLAFAVAAHLEPEILVVDEVLAVGDAQFQKKCLGKMEDVSKNEGRTVLFVSHNIDAISTLTNKCILLSKGTLLSKGPTDETIARYLQHGSTLSIYKNENPRKDVYFSEISTSNKGFIHNEAIEFDLTITSNKDIQNLNIGIGLYNMFDQYVGNVILENAFDLKPGNNQFRVSVGNHNLVPNDYRGVFGLATKSFDMLDSVIGEPGFTIFNDDNDSFLLTRWSKQFGNHYLSDVKIQPL